MSEITISLVLPVYNQADHIGEIINEYREALTRVDGNHEIILVTNGCRDDSPEICVGLAEKYENVRQVNSREGGWGLAVKIGIQKARGELICYTNSARTSPEELVLMLLYARAYPEVVIKANRRIRDSWFRRLGSLLYNLQCRLLFDLSTWDINGTPKVFPRGFEKLMALTQSDDMIDAEFNVLCRREEYPVLEVPMFSTKRHGGKSTTNIRSALRMYWGAYKLRRDLDAESE